MSHDHRIPRIMIREEPAHRVDRLEMDLAGIPGGEVRVKAAGVANAFVVVHDLAGFRRPGQPIAVQRHVSPKCATKEMHTANRHGIVLEEVNVGFLRFFAEALGEVRQFLAVEFVIAADVDEPGTSRDRRGSISAQLPA